MPKTLHIKTLGCKVNTYDSHALENQFKALGYEISSATEHVDVTIINTCSVTAKADHEARYLARRLRRQSPETLLVVTGCYAQTDSEILRNMSEIDLVIPNEHKEQLSSHVDAYLNGKSEIFKDKLPIGSQAVSNNRQSHFKSSTTLFASAESSRTRAFVKVQDGCNGFCTYCLIPYARGASRSVPIEEVLPVIDELNEKGIQEIVLTGIHIGDYGEDLASPRRLENLIDAILERAHSQLKIRISSLEPSEVSPELLQCIEKFKDRFCPHFHLPLQSGCDRILKQMRRTYNKQEYLEAVKQLRRIFPEASIGADIIPGFPSESHEEFEESMLFCQELQLSYLHVFPYSKRPNTAAARMPDHLDASLVSERSKALRELSAQLKRRYAQGFIGKEVDALWEDQVDDQGRRLGKSSNYLDLCARKTSLNLEPGERSKAIILGFQDQRLLVQPLLGPISDPQAPLHRQQDLH